MWTGWSDLVALWSGHDDHFKGLAFAEGHISILLLWAPGSILTGVEDDFVPAVKPRVEVEGDVAGLRLSAEQVEEKPAKSNSSWTRDIMSVSPEVTDKLVQCQKTEEMQTVQVGPTVKKPRIV